MSESLFNKNAGWATASGHRYIVKINLSSKVFIFKIIYQKL